MNICLTNGVLEHDRKFQQITGVKTTNFALDEYKIILNNGFIIQEQWTLLVDFATIQQAIEFLQKNNLLQQLSDLRQIDPTNDKSAYTANYELYDIFILQDKLHYIIVKKFKM